MTESQKPVALWWLGLRTLAYFLAGKLGLSLAVVNESVSPVWPPTGIAFASFLLLGPRIWPAIFAGAFLVNVTTTGSIATSIGIALGNTFEGRLGADLVRIFANGRDVFNRSRDVFKFVVLGGLFSTTVSATIGASILTLGGNANWREYPAIWFTWWLGDAVGALVVGPVLVLWSAPIAVPRGRTRQLERVGLFATVIAVCVLVFYGFVGQPLTFLCLPPLVWAAFRFGQRETAAASGSRATGPRRPSAARSRSSSRPIIPMSCSVSWPGSSEASTSSLTRPRGSGRTARGFRYRSRCRRSEARRASSSEPPPSAA